MPSSTRAPFRTQFQDQGQSPLQLISAIGSLQQGRADLQLGKEKLQFQREQAAIENQIAKQNAQAAAQAATTETMKFYQGILNDASRPDEELTAAMDGLTYLMTGEKTHHTIDQALPRYGYGKQLLQIMQTYGAGSDQFQSAKAQYDLRFPPVAGKTGDSQTDKHYGNFDFNDYGRFDVMKDGILTDEEQRVIVSLADTGDKVHNLAFLTGARAMRESQGKPVSQSLEAAITALEVDSKVPGTTPDQRRALEKAQAQTAEGHNIIEQAEAAKKMLQMVYGGEEVKNVQRTANDITDFFKDNTTVAAMQESVKLAKTDEDKARAQRILDSYLQSQSQGFYDRLQGDLAQVHPYLKQAVEEKIPQMRGQLNVQRGDLRRQGKDTSLIDAQLQAIEVGERAIRKMMDLGQGRGPGPNNARLRNVLDINLAEAQGAGAFRDKILTPILEAANTLKSMEPTFDQYITQGEGMVRAGQAQRQAIQSDLLAARTAGEGVKQDNAALEGLGKIIRNAASVSGADVVDPVTGTIRVSSLLEKNPQDVELFIDQIRLQLHQSTHLRGVGDPFLARLEDLQTRIKRQRTEFKEVTKALPLPTHEAVQSFVQEAEAGKAQGVRKRQTFKDSESGRRFTMEVNERGQTVITTKGKDGPVTFILTGLGKDQAWIVAPES